MLIVAAILALGVGYYVPQTFSAKPAIDSAKADGDGAKSDSVGQAEGGAPRAAGRPRPPGRVEPIGGEVRIGAQVPGRDRRGAGCPQRQGCRRRSAGAPRRRGADRPRQCRARRGDRAQARARQRRESVGQAGAGSQDPPRTAWPTPSGSSCRAATSSIAPTRRAATARRAMPTSRRRAMPSNKAKERLDQARAKLRKALAADGLPAPTRPEAALTAARADLVRGRRGAGAHAHQGRLAGTVAAGQCQGRRDRDALARERADRRSATCPSLRVRAEIEERDIGKLRVGQAAIVRSDAFPGKDFEGKIASLAQALGPSRIGQRGPRKPTDVDVLEVHDRSRRPAAAAAGHARRRVPQARHDGQRAAGELGAGGVRRRDRAGRIGIAPALSGTLAEDSGPAIELSRALRHAKHWP